MNEEPRPDGDSGKPTRFVPLPVAVVDRWLPVLTGSQVKLLLVVVRQTRGFRDPATGRRKAEDWLTHRQLMAKTGCASQAVSGAVDALVQAGLIRVRDADGAPRNTPQSRRRSAGRLLYGLGPVLLPGPDAVPETGQTLKSGIRKSKTTKESINKRDFFVVFESQKDTESHEEAENRGAGGGDEGTDGEGSCAAGWDWVWRRRDARWIRVGGHGRKPGPPDKEGIRK